MWRTAEVAALTGLRVVRLNAWAAEGTVTPAHSTRIKTEGHRYSSAQLAALAYVAAHHASQRGASTRWIAAVVRMWEEYDDAKLKRMVDGFASVEAVRRIWGKRPAEAGETDERRVAL